MRLIDRELHGRLLAPVREAAADPEGDAFLRDHLLGADARSLLDRAADVDVDGYLPEFQLTYMDRMTMAHGLEARSPLCDYTLVEQVMGLPASYRLRGSRSKHLLKRVASAWLPEAIVHRPKVGFDSPIGQWFKDELKPFLIGFLAPVELQRTGLLAPDAVQGMLSAHWSGARDYSLQLWSIVMLEAWHRLYVEGGATDPRTCRLADLRGVPASVVDAMPAAHGTGR